MGWKGLRNGELLARAAVEKFEALITKDAGMEYRQSSATLPVAVVILQAKSNAMDDLRPLVPELLNALENLKSRSVTTIGGR